jgi:hypothetical protein
MTFNHNEVEDIIERAIIRAFERLGIDTEDASEARADFVWLRRRRQFSDTAWSRILITVFGLGVTAALYSMWDGIKTQFH